MFKEGDRVVCVNNKINIENYTDLYANKTYTVASVFQHYDGDVYIVLEEIEYCQGGTYYNSNRFMSVTNYRNKKLKKISILYENIGKYKRRTDN